LWGWLYLVSLFATRETQHQCKKRDRRILSNNSYFTRIKLNDGWRGNVILRSKRKPPGSTVADMTFSIEEWKEALAKPGSMTSNGTVIKDSGSGTVVRREISVADKCLDVYIKRPRLKSKFKKLLSSFRKSRCKKAFTLGHELLTRSIPTALPIATLERRRFFILKDSMLITESVESSHLHGFMINEFGTSSQLRQEYTHQLQHRCYREIMMRLGKMVQRLHDNYYFHRDLKATNILISWNRKAKPLPDILLVDLDGLSHVRFMTCRRRFRGLMRLNVSLLQCPPVNNSGRLRVLIGYLDRFGARQMNFKPFWRQLEEWSSEKLQEQLRSRRKRQKAVRNPR